MKFIEGAQLYEKEIMDKQNNDILHSLKDQMDNNSIDQFKIF